MYRLNIEICIKNIHIYIYIIYSISLYILYILYLESGTNFCIGSISLVVFITI